MSLDAGLFTKRRPGAPAGFFAVEAAGLDWLGRAGGVPVVRPVEVAADRLVLPRLVERPPTTADADELGRRLAVTHAAGAGWFGCPPGDWHGDGFIGPLPLPHAALREAAPPTWPQFHARLRVLPFLRAAVDAGRIDPADAASVGRVCDRLEDPDGAGWLGPAEPPDRIHGDLWSGNVLWTSDGAVLVDPAAHGGHRESDLAMLALFGLPFLDRVLAAYDEAATLADGWQDRVGLHQLHPLLVHAVLFGGGYGGRAGSIARRLR